MFLKIAAVSILLLSTRTVALPPAGPVYPRSAPPVLSTSTRTDSSLAASSSPASTDGYGPLVLARMLLAQSTLKCKEDGCGCAVLHLTVQACTSDKDACREDVTLAAMVCGQCNADQASIDIYNRYLSACVKIEMTSPSDTVVVSISDSASSSAPLSSASGLVSPSHSPSPSPTSLQSQSDVGASSATVLGLVTNKPSRTDSRTPSHSDSPALSSSSSLPISSVKVLVAVQKEEEEGSSSGSNGDASTTTSITDNETTLTVSTSVVSPKPSASSVSPDLSRPDASLSVMASSTLTYNILSMSTITSSGSDGIVGVVGVQTRTASASASALSLSKNALAASTSFFDYSIDAKCDDDCSIWKDLTSTCSDDGCLCVPKGLRSAAACSECLGATTHGEAYQRQVGFYNAYTGNCSAVASPGSASQSSTSLGYDVVAAESSSTTRSTARSDGPTGTKAGAEAVVTVISGSERVLNPTVPSIVTVLFTVLASLTM